MMKTKFYRLFITLSIICLFIPFCKKEKSSLFYEEGIVDGVKLIHNFSYEKFEQVELVEDLSIGFDQEDENYIFEYPRDIDTDSSGNIYVMDYSEPIIKKYGPRGRYVKNIGRQGQGPGEFEMPMSICVSSQDFLYCADLMQNEIEVFNPDGNPLKTIKLNYASPEEITVLGDGEILVGYDTYIESETEPVKRSYNIGKYLPQENKLDIIFKKEQLRFDDVKSTQNNLNFKLPYFVKWYVSQSGNIYLGSADKYEVNVYSLSGSLLFKFVRDYEPFKVNGETKKKILDVFRRLNIDPREYMKYIDSYPVFRSINIDGKGRVWIELYKSPTDETSKEVAIFDVFTLDGKFLFTTKINVKNTYHFVFKNGNIYTLSADEEGFLGVKRFKVLEH